MSRIIIVLLNLVLVACAGTREVIPAEQYDAVQHARLRVFAMNGLGAGFSFLDCDGKQQRSMFLMGLKELLGDNKKNRVRIGMTQTPNTDLAERNNILYREFVIPTNQIVKIVPSVVHFVSKCQDAGKPCTVESKQQCKNKDIRYFAPKPGQQYEFMPMGCAVTLLNITEEEIVKEPTYARFSCHQ